MMNIVVCVDDKLGLSFNNRRQSMDTSLRQKLLHYCGNRKLWMRSYTAKQFVPKPVGCNIVVDDNFLEKAGSDDYCFVEIDDISPYSDKIHEIILFRWNRTYPADRHLKIPGSASDWKISVIDEFPGKSHKKITMESWRRIK